MSTPVKTQDFTSKIVSNLSHFKSSLDKLDFDSFRYNLDDHENSEFLTKTHKNLVEKFVNLSKVEHTQVQFNANTRMVQSIIEDFTVLSNKLNESDHALAQIEILKDYQERYVLHLILTKFCIEILRFSRIYSETTLYLG
jgi:hypothetical protein